MAMLLRGTRTAASAATRSSAAAVGRRARTSLATPVAPVAVEVDTTARIATLLLQARPTNAVTPAVLKAAIKALDEIEADRGLRGLVLTSNIDNYFSVGISLEVFGLPELEWREYWNDMRTFFFRLYSSRLMSIATVNGHAPGKDAGRGAAAPRRSG